VVGCPRCNMMGLITEEMNDKFGVGRCPECLGYGEIEPEDISDDTKVEVKARALRPRAQGPGGQCTLCEKGKIADGVNLIGNFTWITCPCCDGNWENCRKCQAKED